MNVRNFLAVAAVVAFVFGLGFVVVPGPLMGLYGVSLDAVGTVIGQLFGAALIGFGALNWLARGLHNHDAEALRPILMANLVSDALGFVLALFAQISGRAGVNALGWSTVVIYLLLALGFAYFLFMPQGRPVASARR
jgi:hypothetical protein